IWNSFKSRSDVEGFPAAAPALLVGIAEAEAGLKLVLDPVHLRAEDEHRRFGIDEDGDALVFHHLVPLSLLVGVFERVGEARAAARPYADANAHGRLASLREERLDAFGRGVS